MLGGDGFYEHRQGATHFFKQRVHSPGVPSTVLVMENSKIYEEYRCSLNTANLKLTLSKSETLNQYKLL